MMQIGKLCLDCQDAKTSPWLHIPPMCAEGQLADGQGSDSECCALQMVMKCYESVHLRISVRLNRTLWWWNVGDG